MEADWSVAIGGDLPVVVIPWEGFVDLRGNAEAIERVTEARDNQALAEALMALNWPSSPVFTAKCDLWPLAASDIDPFEFEAKSEDARQGIACYIDILARDPLLYASFAMHERWMRNAAGSLRSHPQSQARIELVLRPAVMANEASGFAITLYVSACAANEIAAKDIWQSALQAATAITMREAATGE